FVLREAAPRCPHPLWDPRCRRAGNVHRVTSPLGTSLLTSRAVAPHFQVGHSGASGKDSYRHAVSRTRYCRRRETTGERCHLPRQRSACPSDDGRSHTTRCPCSRWHSGTVQRGGRRETVPDLATQYRGKPPCRLPCQTDRSTRVAAVHYQGKVCDRRHTRQPSH